MQVHRKGTNDAIALRLQLTQKTSDQLWLIMGARDPGRPSRYQHDAKTRNAAAAVLRVRGEMAEPL